MTERRFTTADLLLVSVAIIWGINVVIVKIALSELSPLVFNSLRFIIATALSWALLLWREPKHRLHKADLLNIAWLGLLGHAFYQVLFISGINLTTAGNTSLLLATMPIWVALLSSFFRIDIIKPQAILGILVSFAGIILVTVGGGKSISLGGTMRGDLLILAGTWFYAFYTIKSKPLLSRYTPLQFSTYTMTAGAIGLLAASINPLLTQDWDAVSPAGWGGLFFSAAFAIVIGYYIWNNGVQQLGPARTAIYGNLSPAVAMVSGWLILSEPATFAQLCGAALIIGGLYVARRAKTKDGERSSEAA